MTEPDVEQVIAPESQLASLMLSTSLNAGTVDNVMDNADCMSVELPVTIIVNGITITVETIEDLELVHEIFEEYLDDEDVVEFIFPITIVLNDHTEVIIEDKEELDSFVDSCEDEEEEVIECVNFVYPITFSIYNTSFQVIETVTIENDRQLYHFMRRIRNAEQAILASLNFPVKLKYDNGEIIEVNNNSELQRAIELAEDMCGRDDDCDIEEVNESLVECHWMIHYYNEDDNYRPFALKFKENGELKIINASATQVRTGKWETVETDNGVVLVISEVNELVQEINGRWKVVECDDERFKLIRPANSAASVDEARMVLKQRCADEPDCTAQEIRESLRECRWYSGANLPNSSSLGKFYFGEDGLLKVEDLANDTTIEGSWKVELTDYGIKLIIELPEPYAHYSGRWKIYECGDGRIKVIKEDRYIVFEQDCEDDCVIDDYDLRDFMLDCDVKGSLFDENENPIEEYTFSFDPNYGFDVSDSDGTIDSGIWAIHAQADEVLKLSLDELSTINLIDGNWYLYECNEEELIFKQETNNGYRYLKLRKDCSNPFECFEDKDVVICDDGDEFDGMATFNLNEIYEECPNDDVEITFHISEDDAEEGVNPVSTEYTNPNNQQPLWVRVALAGTVRYEVFFVVLYVEDCSSCTEEDIDNILMEPNCHWVPVKLNESDDYSGFDFYFNDNQDLVVKDANNNETIAAWSTNSGTGEGVVVSISQLDNNLETFNRDWTVKECDAERLVLTNDGQELVLERECQ